MLVELPYLHLSVMETLLLFLRLCPSGERVREVTVMEPAGGLLPESLRVQQLEPESGSWSPGYSAFLLLHEFGLPGSYLLKVGVQVPDPSTLGG